MLNNIPAFDFAALTAPVQKLTDLNTKTFAKAQANAEEQLKLAQARTEAALAIKDVAGFQTFVAEQTELAKTAVADLPKVAKTAAEDVKAYFAEVQAILSESQAAIAK